MSVPNFRPASPHSSRLFRSAARQRAARNPATVTSAKHAQKTTIAMGSIDGAMPK